VYTVFDHIRHSLHFLRFSIFLSHYRG
jgi:hypothetical protein